jgi:eukaryotic-like serine/threonine-protein kinase
VNEESIFLEALGKSDPGERAHFLDQVCAGNAAQRERIEKLLAAHPEAGDFLEQPAGPIGGAVAEAAAAPAAGEPPPEPGGTEQPGVVLAGRYKLLEAIGEGGMGTVWMAQQTEPVKRLVAVKLIKQGMDSKQVLARFEAERQALALMDHPNIAKVFDAGATEVHGSQPVGLGRPFFVMELVKGVPITRYCDAHRLTPRQRLELFVPVCAAVQHAHQKGIIHRDLKPSNVLVALYDDKPVPKVIDFGVAKATGPQLTEQTLHTGFGAVVGTLEYMSPEQASFNQLDVDTRSDIYALGVLLYELLAGSPPFSRQELEKAGMLEMLRVIREQEPSKPSTKLSTADRLPTLAANRGTEPKRLTALVRGELDWIVMKALEKDRNRRYETANGFGMDVQRYLADEPVLACPPSAGYRLRKFARRNKRTLVTAAVVALAVLLVAGTFGWAVRDRASRQAKLEAEVGRAIQDAEDAYQRNKLPEARAAVERADSLLASGGASAELQQRVRRWQDDLRMVTRLEEIRLERAAASGEGIDWLGADQAYREQFQQYGVTPEAPDPTEPVARIRASAIRKALVAGLDDWVLTKWITKRSGWEQLLAVARAADPDPWRDRLRAALAQNDRKALEELARNEVALAQPPPTVELLADVVSLVGNEPLAVDVLRQAQRQNPGDFWINFRLGYYLEKLKPAQTPEAARFYQAALALRPESVGVYIDFGNALRVQGKLDDARTLFREAIRLRPDDVKAHLSLGHTLGDEQKWAEAAACYEKAVQLQPNYAPAHYNLGFAYVKQTKLEQAVPCFRKAIELQPDYANGYNGLGQALVRQARWQEGFAAFEQAIRLEPDTVVFHTDLAWWLTTCPEPRFCDPQRAVAASKKAVDLTPRSVEAWQLLGWAHYQAGEWKASIEALEKSMALQNGGNAHQWFCLAMARRQLGDGDEARKWFDRAVEWMEKYAPQEEVLRRFRLEAEQVLEIKKQ